MSTPQIVSLSSSTEAFLVSSVIQKFSTIIFLLPFSSAVAALFNMLCLHRNSSFLLAW